jgi:hypothetical protein
MDGDFDEDGRNVGGGGSGELNPFAPHRKRQYPPDSQGPFRVFIRDAGAGLPHLKISRHLHEKYKSITSLTKLNKSKFRVILNDRNEANSIPHDNFFNDCRAYIQAKTVEVDGVVHIPDLSVDEEAVMSFGKGRFRFSSLQKLDVIDAFRFSKSITVGETTEKVYSVYMRITFPGTVLPDQLDLDGLLISVTKCKEKIMICKKCLKYGHTSQYCTGSARCIKCGEVHDGANCRITEFKCPNCKKKHNKLGDCETFKELKDSMEKKAKRKLDMSYAEATRSWTTFNFQLPNPVQNQNPYSILGQQNEAPTSQSNEKSAASISGRKKNKKQKKNTNVAVNPSKKRRIITDVANENNVSPVPSTTGTQTMPGTEATPPKSLPLTRKRFEYRQPQPPPVPSTSGVQRGAHGETNSPKAMLTPRKRFDNQKTQSQSDPTPSTSGTQRAEQGETNSFQQPPKNKKRLAHQNIDNRNRFTAFSRMVDTFCDLFKLSPEIKNLVLTLLVPIIEQIWPSISTLKMPVINLTCHG